MTSDEHYVEWLCEIIEKHKVDMIIPGIDADMYMWNKERERIKRTGVTILLNNPTLIDVCSDKWGFYEKLKATGSLLAIESTRAGSFKDLVEKFGLPFLLKPRRGFASKGIVVVDSEKMFIKYQNDLGTVLMAQPIVGSNDEEYTISAFFDNDSNLLCFMGLKRKLAKEGYTEKALVSNLEGAENAIRELAILFKPIGPTNFQFRVHNGQIKLLEINPRISSATSIRAAFDYNESVMSVEYFLNNVVPTQPEIKQGYAIRYAEEHIFYDSNSI